MKDPTIVKIVKKVGHHTLERNTASVLFVVNVLLGIEF
jgi:hypothetical protein